MITDFTPLHDNPIGSESTQICQCSLVGSHSLPLDVNAINIDAIKQCFSAPQICYANSWT